MRISRAISSVLVLAALVSPLSSQGEETRITLRHVSARLADDDDGEEKRLPVVYQSEAEYLAAQSHTPHVAANTYSAHYGYLPNCQCEDVQYAAGLWTGFCESRRTSWYQKWLLGPLRSRHCGCGDCHKTAK